jgi:hypothetical protein
MELDLKFLWPDGRQWFHPGETIQGCVFLKVSRPKRIREIYVVLTGNFATDHPRSRRTSSQD